MIGGAIYAMCRYAPMAGGSGIPQVKGVILGLMKMKWLRILWVKILAGAIGIGAGLSLGSGLDSQDRANRKREHAPKKLDTPENSEAQSKKKTKK